MLPNVTDPDHTRGVEAGSFHPTYSPEKTPPTIDCLSKTELFRSISDSMSRLKKKKKVWISFRHIEFILCFFFCGGAGRVCVCVCTTFIWTCWHPSEFYNNHEWNSHLCWVHLFRAKLTLHNLLYIYHVIKKGHAHLRKSQTGLNYFIDLRNR